MVGRNIREHPNFKKYSFFHPSRDTLNIFNKDQLKNYIQQYDIDTVINAAGRVGGIQDNMDNPFDFLHENILIGMNLACVAKEIDLPRILNLSSSCMYPRNFKDPIREEDLLTDNLEKTNEGYALAKITSMKYLEYLSQESGHSYKTLVPCNLYGRYDHFDLKRSHLIASTGLTHLKNKP